MRSLIKNKKGDIFQLFFLLIIMFIAIIVTILCVKMSTEIDGAFQTAPNYNDSIYSEKVTNFVVNQSPTIGDMLILFLFIGGIIGLMVSAIRTNYSPSILFIFLLVSVIAVFVASGIVNIYSGFAQTEALSDIATKFTVTNILFSRYTPLFTCIISAVILILMYSKSGNEIQI